LGSNKNSPNNNKLIPMGVEGSILNNNNHIVEASEEGQSILRYFEINWR
jgi:hypothetical protein